MRDALAGFRLLEIGDQVSAAYAGHLLAGYGASVTRISGLDGVLPDAEAAPWQRAYGNLKQTVHLKSLRDFAPLLHDCDALLTTLRPNALAAFGLDSEVFIRDRLLCAVTSLGWTGSWHDYAAGPLNAWHLTGAGLHYFRRPGQEPITAGFPAVDAFAGLCAALAVIAGRLVQRATGAGQLIDIASADGLLTQFVGCPLLTIAASSLAPEEKRFWFDPPAALAMPPFPCRDGYFFFYVYEEAHWRLLAQVMDDEVLNSSGLFGGNFEERSRYLDIINERIRRWTSTKSRAELFAICLDRRIPGAPLSTMAEIVSDSTLRRRGILAEADGEGRKPLVVPGAPIHVSTYVPGETTDAHRIEQQPLKAPGEPRDVLAGLRVVNFGQIWAGSLVGQILAELGAEVIKIETKQRPDLLRRTNPLLDGGFGAYAECLFRSQKSMDLNLKSAEGIVLARELVAGADVVVENFGPNAMERLGLGFDALRELNPRLIMLSISPTGRHSDYQAMVAYGSIIDAFAGLHALQGYAGEQPRDFARASTFADPGTGLAGALAVLAAISRQREGASGALHLDLGMRDVAISWLGGELMEYQQTGESPGPRGNRSKQHAPHNVYATAEPEGWLAVSVETEAEWRSLVAAAGEEGLPDGLAGANARRRKENEAAIDGWLAAWARGRGRDEAVSMLQSRGVKATPVLSVPEIMTSEHFADRSAWVELARDGRIVVTPGLPWKLSRTPASIRQPAEEIGGHTEQVLRDWLGRTEVEIAELKTSGAIG